MIIKLSRGKTATKSPLERLPKRSTRGVPPRKNQNNAFSDSAIVEDRNRNGKLSKHRGLIEVNALIMEDDDSIHGIPPGRFLNATRGKPIALCGIGAHRASWRERERGRYT